MRLHEISNNSIQLYILTLNMEYRKEQQGQTITLWDDTHGIGLQFTEGDTLQRYASNIVTTSEDIASTEEGVALLEQVINELTEEAAKLYPKEFAPMP